MNMRDIKHENKSERTDSHPLDVLKEQTKVIDHHNNKLFEQRYDELATKFLDYQSSQKTFEQIIGKDEQILELGSGTGNFLLKLKESGFKNISGLEPNKEFNQTLKKKAHDKGFTNLSIHQGDILTYSYDTAPPTIYSHSGPMFITQHEGKLYYEGLHLPSDEKQQNEQILQRLFKHIATKNGKFLMNIQENKTNISLHDGSIYTLSPAGSGYDTQNYKVTKHYQFTERNGEILPNGGQSTYEKYACTLDHLKNLAASIGSFNFTNHNNKWLIITPKNN